MSHFLSFSPSSELGELGSDFLVSEVGWDVGRSVRGQEPLLDRVEILFGENVKVLFHLPGLGLVDGFHGLLARDLLPVGFPQMRLSLCKRDKGRELFR